MVISCYLLARLASVETYFYSSNKKCCEAVLAEHFIYFSGMTSAYSTFTPHSKAL